MSIAAVLFVASLLLCVHVHSLAFVRAATGGLPHSAAESRASAAQATSSSMMSPPVAIGAHYYNISKRYEGIAVEMVSDGAAVEITLLEKKEYADLMSRINETEQFKVLSSVGLVSQSFPGNGKLLLLPDSNNTSALRHYCFYDETTVVSGKGLRAFDSSFVSLKAKTTYKFALYKGGELEAALADKLMMSYLTTSYKFTDIGFKSLANSSNSSTAVVWPRSSNRLLVLAMASAQTLYKDMVDTPALNMGPADLESVIRSMGDDYEGCNVTSTVGVEDLVDGGFPLIAAVGMAAPEGREPRIVELSWRPARAANNGSAFPRIALIGKGVTFDTGGLNIKGGGGMRNMKRDMAGGAQAIALAKLIMEVQLPVEIHLVIPIAENSIDGRALRPGDILRSRKGLSVEVTNTDAEGRLLLADALALAMERSPELIVDFATLTGAARVALGNDLPAVFSNNRAELVALWEQGDASEDPIWPMPLYEPSREFIRSSIADLVNAADAGGGAITAALFLSEFVSTKQDSGLGKQPTWFHLDFQGSKGGSAVPQGLRCVFEYIRTKYSKESI